MDTDTQATISYALFHPRGPQVTFTSPLEDDARDVIAQIDVKLGAGFSYLPPDLGLLNTVEITHAIHEIYTKKSDGSQVGRLLLYTNFGGKFGADMKIWLDSDDDIARFEAASGVTFTDMVASRSDPIKDSGEFHKFAVPVNFKIDRKKEESASSPVGYKWVLVDYVSAAKSPPEPAPQQASTPPAGGNVKSQARKGKSRDGAAKGVKNVPGKWTVGNLKNRLLPAYGKNTTQMHKDISTLTGNGKVVIGEGEIEVAVERFAFHQLGDANAEKPNPFAPPEAEAQP